MADTTITFEQIDQMMKKVDLTAYQPGGKSHLTAAAAAPTALAIPQLCPIYKAVRPILVVISGLPFIPEAWKSVIKTFIGLLDALCP